MQSMLMVSKVSFDNNGILKKSLYDASDPNHAYLLGRLTFENNKGQIVVVGKDNNKLCFSLIK